MGEQWLRPQGDDVRETTIHERALLLVDLLDLSDALPPVAHRDLDAPTFKELCGRS